MSEKLVYLKVWAASLLLMLVNVESVCSSGIKVKAVPAIYSVEIPNVHTYEATIPIFFHVELPKLPDKFPQHTIDCGNNHKNYSNSSDDNFCALEKQFIAASNHIVRDLQIIKNHLSEESKLRRRRQATPVIAATSLLAGFLLRPAISRFTGNLFGSDEDWTSHFNSIRDSMIEEHKLLLDFEESTHSYTQEMESILSNISEILTTQKRELIWTLRLLSTKLHADIIQEAVQSCKTGHIPGNLIQVEYFKKKLSTLEKTLSTHYNYTLAIDINGNEVSKYYKLPIADCLITPSKAHITINIPVRRKETTWKLHEIIHTKFAFSNQVCELYPQEASYLAVSKPENKSILIASHMLNYCSIFEHQICMIPQFAKDSVQSLRCTAGMHLNADPLELVKSCSFRCYSNDELIITQVGDRKIVITNAVNLTYSCKGNNGTKKLFKFEKLGAIEVNLDCDCEIVINGNEKLPKPFPCLGKNETLEQLFNFTVPILWTNNFSDLENVLDFDIDHKNLSNHINHDWPWLIPVLNFSKEQASNFSVPEKAVFSSFLTLEVWLGLLTFALLLHFILTFYCFFKILLARYGGYGTCSQATSSPSRNSQFSDSSQQYPVVTRRRNYEIGVENLRSNEEKKEFRQSFSNRLI
ncbi:unnamed protein product [Orchesella dallaii]|uniref:Envelope fusion protein n=1 Tax=Orchesella dallaii TaxID=48710 RepID=A0ABP1RLF0_9HEXA